MRRGAITAALTVLFAALLTAIAPATASAGSGEDFAVHPVGTDGGERPFFAYDVRPGETVEDVVRIANFADEPRTFRVYTADGYNTADAGTFALRPEGETSVDVGSWIALGVDRWTVPARSQVDIPVRLEVPTEATPGDHVGGIVALQVPQDTTGDDHRFGLTVQNGVGTRMYVRVEGPIRPALAIDELRSVHSTPASPLGSGQATTTFRVVNIGNIRLSPSVAFEATGALGTIERADLGQFADLLPGSSVEVTHRWSGVPAAGRVSQSIELSAGDLVYTRSASFWVIPWTTLLTALGIMLGTALLVRRRGLIRRLRRSDDGTTGVITASFVLVMTLLVMTLAATIGVHIAAPATAHADAPELSIRPAGRVEPGDSLLVSGSRWPGRDNVVVEICGNSAENGTSDCAVAAGRAVATSADGRFSTELRAAEPPSPCPCVVRAWTVTGERAQVVEPLDMTPGDDSPSARSESGGAPAARLRATALMEGDDSWRRWFGGSVERTLVLTVVNDGDFAVSGAVASMAWEQGGDAVGYLPLVRLERLEPGETREHRIDVNTGVLSFGSLTLRGEVTGVDTPVTFAATTSTHPWGLVAGGPAVALSLVSLAWGMLRRRRSRRVDAIDGELVERKVPTKRPRVLHEEAEVADFIRWVEELRPASIGEDRSPPLPAPVPMLLADVEIDLRGQEPEMVLRRASERVVIPLGPVCHDDRPDHYATCTREPVPELPNPFEPVRSIDRTQPALEHHNATRELAARLYLLSQAEIRGQGLDADIEQQRIRRASRDSEDLAQSLVTAGIMREADIGS